MFFLQQLLECNKCRNSYHPECLGPNYPTKPTKKKKVWVSAHRGSSCSCGLGWLIMGMPLLEDVSVTIIVASLLEKDILVEKSPLGICDLFLIRGATKDKEFYCISFLPFQICTKCVRCKSCGSTTPGKGWDAQWSHDFSLCHDCAKLFAKGTSQKSCVGFWMLFLMFWRWTEHSRGIR